MKLLQLLEITYSRLVRSTGRRANSKRPLVRIIRDDLSKTWGNSLVARIVAQRALALGGQILIRSPYLAQKLVPWLKTNHLVSRVLTFVESTPISDTSSADISSKYLDSQLSNKVRDHVVVVIPVFNSAEISKSAIDSVLRGLPLWASVFIIDDASTDPKVTKILGEYEGDPRVRITKNSNNIGYTANANLAFSTFPDSDIVLLNSDAVVSSKWLESMRYVAYSSLKVATVTAVSDDDGSFSVFDTLHPKPSGVPLAVLEKINRNVSSGHRIEVPTGNGFCMFIRRDALDEVGPYDLQKFPRGYGEENDFSLRALRLGYKSLICDKALVSHLSGQSFGAEKADLLQKAWNQVTTDYPEYPLLINKFNGPEILNVRRRLAAGLRRSEVIYPELNVLYLQPIAVGGVFHSNADLRRALASSVQSFILRSDGKTASLYRSNHDDFNMKHLGSWNLGDQVSAVSHRSDDYDRLILDIVYRHAIDVIHVEHSVWQSLSFVDHVHSLGVPVIASLHDFYTVCPSYNLLDNQGVYCGGVCTSSDGDCSVEIWGAGQMPRLKSAYILEWQRKFGEFFARIDRAIAPSASTAKIVSSVYPELEGKVQIIEHGQDLELIPPGHNTQKTKSKIKILLAGNIFTSKGDELISQISKLDVSGKLEFHFLGTTSQKLRGVGVHHGSYKRSDFAQKIAQIKPDLAFFASKWPETYCYVLTEVWANGLVAVGLDIGAIGDRIRATGNGHLVSPDSKPEDCYTQIVDFAEDIDRLNKAKSNILAWQSQQSSESQLARMGDAYLQAYLSSISMYKRQ